MLLTIDRYIIARFFVNFAILFAVLYMFAVSIDTILHLEHFVEAARELQGGESSAMTTLVIFIKLGLNFQTPRIFQFFAYLHGLVAVGAMGFTLVQMYRYKELVAMMAAGMSLHRVAMPFIGAVFFISVLQLMNQEFLLPKVAPLLLRDHGDIGKRGVDDFEVSFVRDSAGNLLQAARFTPDVSAPVLDFPTILERDEMGRTARRITADRAVWNDEQRAWRMVNGRVMHVQQAPASAGRLVTETIELYRTNLTPEVLTVRRYGQFAAMLSMGQIAQMLRTPGVSDERLLRRYFYARFSTVLVNLLVIAMTLPSFLMREPANLMRCTISAATISIPALVGAAIGMMIELKAFPPAASVFLPVIVLIPMALARMTFVKT